MKECEEDPCRVDVAIGRVQGQCRDLQMQSWLCLCLKLSHTHTHALSLSLSSLSLYMYIHISGFFCSVSHVEDWPLLLKSLHCGDGSLLLQRFQLACCEQLVFLNSHRVQIPCYLVIEELGQQIHKSHGS